MFARIERCLNSQLALIFSSPVVITIAVLIVWMVSQSCYATDRYFHDIRVESNNHRYAVEATSPDNAEGPWKSAFQSDFVYRLTDRAQGRQVWSREQPMRSEQGRRRSLEGPPAAVYVSDEGWVVIRTADHGHPIELIAINREGSETGRVRLFYRRLLPADNFLSHTSLSTAGICWGAGYCHFYFASLRDAPCFCIRGWWGDRLVMSLLSGERIQLDAEDEQALFDAEKQFVMSTLAGTWSWQWSMTEKGLTLVERANQPTLGDVIRAIHLSGTMKLREAAPYLRELQDCPYIGSTGGSFGPYKPAPNGIEPDSYQTLTIRQLSQLSLRRLGIRPSGHQSTKLYRAGEGFWHPEDPVPFDRETRVGQVVRGQTPEQVLERIGAPDFVEFRVWEYDIDDSTPYTLMIEWGEDGVEEVTRQTPAKWADGITRDRYFAL